MSRKPQSDQAGAAELAEQKRKEAEQEKKLEAERIAQERARFGGGGLLTPDQKNQQSQLGG
jgi:hypothetical protein